MPVQYMNTQLFAFFFSQQRAPAWLHKDLNTVDAHWRRLICWLRAEAWVSKHKHWSAIDSDRGSTVLQLYTAYKQYTTGSGCCIYQWLTKRRHSLRHLLKLCRGRRRHTSSEIFKNQPNEGTKNCQRTALYTCRARRKHSSRRLLIFFSRHVN